MNTHNTNNAKHVVVGLSGGVDSAVSAHLLKEAGYDVTAVFMQNWDNGDSNCHAHEDLSMARQVCDQLHIDLQTVNFCADYWDHVFQHFLDEYAAGRTPNPDVLCNREIKFKAFLEHAKLLGADAMATGHYAQIVQDGATGEHTLQRGLDPVKDQSYFLCLLSQQQLAFSLMPLGAYTKTTVRQTAKRIGLGNWQRKDSTGICFIGERRFQNFLSEFLLAQPGSICDEHGKQLGTHQGIMYYTLGQRQGLGLGGIRGAPESPWYVVAKDVATNTLVVAQGHDHPALYKQSLDAKQMHWVAGQAPNQTQQLQARIRHGQTPQACHIKRQDDGITVNFEQPQFAVAPGQIVALYDGTVCLGGGVIAERLA